MLACLVSFAPNATAQPSPGSKSETAKAKPQPKIKRIVQSLELVARKKSRFDGLVTLRLVGEKRGRDLHYYWGGQCKKSRLKTAHIQMLMTAMQQRLAVEIPSYPQKLDRTVVNCIRSVRIVAD